MHFEESTGSFKEDYIVELESEYFKMYNMPRHIACDSILPVVHLGRDKRTIHLPEEMLPPSLGGTSRFFDYHDPEESLYESLLDDVYRSVMDEGALSELENRLISARALDEQAAVSAQIAHSDLGSRGSETSGHQPAAFVQEPSPKRGRTDTTTLNARTRRKGLK